MIASEAQKSIPLYTDISSQISVPRDPEKRQHMKALIVDDDPIISANMEKILAGEAFDVTVVNSLSEFDQLWPNREYDVVIVDLHLPDGSGKDIIIEIATRQNTGVIVVSGDTDEFISAITLELGADDFIKKPFMKADLMARVRSVLRRVGKKSSDVEHSSEASNAFPARNVPLPTINFSGFTLDPNSRVLLNEKGKKVHLTKSEFDLLNFLVTNREVVHERQALLEAIRRPGWVGEGRLVDGLINRLRTKLGNQINIQTVRGVGYFVSFDGISADR